MTTDIAVASPLAAAIAATCNAVTSPHSRAAYRGALSRFFAWLDDRPVSRGEVLAYKSALEAKGLKPRSVACAISAIRCLAKEAYHAGAIPREALDAISDIPVRRIGASDRGTWLTEEQCRALLASVAQREGLKARRDTAVLALLLGCGIRVSEAAALRWKDIETRDGRPVLNVWGKGNKPRLVGAPAWVMSAVYQWGAAHEQGEHILLAVAAVAPGRHSVIHGKGLSVDGIANIVRAAGQSIGIAKLAPHDLRRTWANLAHRNGASLVQLQREMGHSSLATTNTYMGQFGDFRRAVGDHFDPTTKGE